MKRNEEVTVDTDDNRVEGHTFERGYSIHDIAEAHVTSHLQHMGFVVEQWGINRREDDHVLGDDKLDLKVHNQAEWPSPVTDSSDGEIETTELLSLLEIKSKTSEDWFGIINRSHFRKYFRRSMEMNTPAQIYMSLVDEDDKRIVRDTFLPVEGWDEYDRVMAGEFNYYGPDNSEEFLVEQIDNHPQVERTFRAPDGDQVVKLDLDRGFGWPELTAVLAPM